MRQHSPFFVIRSRQVTLFIANRFGYTIVNTSYIYSTRTLPNSDLGALNVIMKAAGYT
jgi:hypothetical protein